MPYTRAFVLSAIFGVVVLSALALYGDAPRLVETARAYPMPLLIPVVLLTSVNYALRWVKWRYYLHLVGATAVRPADSVLIFLSGFAIAGFGVCTGQRGFDQRASAGRFVSVLQLLDRLFITAQPCQADSQIEPGQ